MKKTQIIELFKNIKKTGVSFFSIQMFVALAVSVFLGINWSSGALLTGLDTAVEKGNFYDLQLIFPYGVDDEDLEELKSIDGVDEIEGSNYTDRFFKIDGETYQAKIQQLNEGISFPIGVKGRLPSTKEELAVDVAWAESNDIKEGSRIVFEGDDTEYTVTALVESPDYLNVDPTDYGASAKNQLAINCGMYVVQEFFEGGSLAEVIPDELKEQFRDYSEPYNMVNIRSNSLRNLGTFSDEYKDGIEELKQDVAIKAAEIADDKYSALKGHADQINEDAIAELDYALSRINAGKRTIASAEKKLAAAKVTLKESKALLKSKKAELDEAERKIGVYDSAYKEGEAYVESYKNTLREAIDQFLQNPEDLDNAIACYEKVRSIHVFDDIDTLYAKYSSDISELSAPYNTVKQIQSLVNNQDYFGAMQLISDSYSDFVNLVSDVPAKVESGRAELNTYKAQYSEYEAKINDGEKTLKSKEKELKAAKRKISGAEGQYQAGLEKLAEYQEALKTLKNYGCSIQSRRYNISLFTGIELSKIFKRLCFSMAALFLVVGLLVCYSAISRIVNDQIISIGTKKALGLNQKEITLSYLTYTGLAVIVGCIVGTLAAVFIVEKILVNAILESFILPGVSLYFSAKQMGIICGAEILLILLVTYAACARVLKRNAVELLAGEKPPLGRKRWYEKLPLWNRLSLLSQTIINNCANDKRRVLGTIIGVAGCTALMVSALSMNENVLHSFDVQFNDYFHFDTVVRYDKEKEGAAEEIKEILDRYGVQNAEVISEICGLSLPNGDPGSASILVPVDEKAFKELVTIVPSGKQSRYNEDGTERNPYDGIWMSHAYDNTFDTEIGDELEITDIEGIEHSAEISGFFYFHNTNCQIIMSQAAYKETFDREIKGNNYLADTRGVDVKALKKELAEVDGYIACSDYYNISKRSFEEFRSISGAMVAVYFLLSVLMAVLVLLNLLTMFVSEKKKELIVLMINGFTLKDARRYIYSDTILLTFIGILFGLIIGCVMGDAAVRSFEGVATLFCHNIIWSACGIAAAGSAVLSFIVSLIALRKIKKFELSDINK